MYSDMSIWMSASASPNMNSARVRARKVFPTPVGPRKTKEPIGRLGSLRSARERRSALLIAMTASSCPMTLPLSSLSIARSFCGLLLLHPGQRNARPLRDDVHDLVLGDEHLLLFLVDAPFGENRSRLVFGLFLAVAQRGRLLEILSLDGGFLVDADLLDLRLDILHVRRPRHGGDARTRAGFIHHIDGLVGQETAGEVAVGELCGRFERFIRNPCLVMGLVFRADPLEDENGLINARRLHLDGLETTFERGVLLDVFAVFVERGRADALQLAAGERRLDDI